MRPTLHRLVVLLVLAGAVTANTDTARAGSGPWKVPDSAYGEGSVDEGDPRVETRLIVDRPDVDPGGSFRAGVLFSIDPDWHIYWRNSGDSGMSTKVQWSGDGIEFGPLQWPAPKAHAESKEIVTFGYVDEVLLFSEATVSEEASGEVEVSATVDYLACKVDCIPGSAELSRTVSVGGGKGQFNTRPKRAFETSAARLPKPPKSLGVDPSVVYSQKPVRPGDTFRAGIGLDYCAEGPKSCRTWKIGGEVEAYRFIPDATAQVSWRTLEVRPHPSAKQGAVLVLEGKANSNAPEEDERLSGIVWLEGEEGESEAIRVDAPVPRGPSGAEVESLEPELLAMSEAAGGTAETGETATVAAASSGAELQSGGGTSPTRRLGFWQALLFAFLGGMILNLMPCVFPVLALKVTSFAEVVHKDRSHALAHGAAYTGGIVGSMLVLAAVVLGLRVAGTEVGWGFQFQNPLFPAVLAAVVVAFALNLFGVFEIHVEASSIAKTTQKASGLRRSFGEGILAVVLATPCSAPFLGTAVGFALTASAPTVLVVFAALGLGLAAPFVVLTLVPGWSSVLPDPGPWMGQIRNILGFLLLGAAIWLVWVAGRTVGVDAMARILAFLGVVGFAVWVFGVGQNSGRGFVSLLAGASAVALLWGGWLLSQTYALELVVQLGAGIGLFAVAAAIVGSVRGRDGGVAGAALGAALVGTVLAGTWALDFPAQAASQSTAAVEGAGSSQGYDWEAWSEERVDRRLREGRPVFVDFTADWCITCKVNERTVLSTDRVRAAFENHDVAMLKADWTDGDPVIRDKLKSFGKAGVPLYLVYSPDAPDDPKVLPEVLTPETVVDALEGAAGEGSEEG